jgi:hypothetical protein
MITIEWFFRESLICETTPELKLETSNRTYNCHFLGALQENVYDILGNAVAPLHANHCIDKVLQKKNSSPYKDHLSSLKPCGKL